MKRLILFASIAFIALSSIASAQAPQRKVLLEEFTGTWCGWCPRGIWAIEQMEEQYPDNFIPISFHNSDPMQIPTGQDTLESTIPGFPDGWIDRSVVTGSRDIDPQDWVTAVEARLSEDASAGVTISDVTYDPKTRVMSATINANFVTAVAGDLRFNCYVVEDSVSGPAGTTWDQHNYLTGNSNYSDNPFYSLPSVVPNYQHLHVVRAVLGGAYGTKGLIPNPSVVGTKYSATYTFTLPMNIKPDNTSIVGCVMAYSATASKNEVLNSEVTKLTNLPLISGFSASITKKYITATRSGVTNHVVTLTNNNANELTAALSIDALSSILPTGWRAAFSSETVTIPAKGTVMDTLQITAPAKAGYASVYFNALPVSENAVAHATSMNIGALSEGTKYISYGTDGFLPTHVDASYTSDFAAVPLDAEVLAAYPSQSFDVSIYPNINFFDYQNLTGAPAAVLPSMIAAMDAGKKVLVTSTFGMYYEFDPKSPYISAMNTSDAQDFFGTRLGVTYQSLQFRYNTSTGAAVNTTVKGFDNDPVGNGISFTCGFYQSDVFTIDDPTHTSPVVFFDNQQDVVGGFRYDNGSGQRLVYLDLNFGLTASGTSTTQAKTLIKQSIDFLLNGAQSDVPSNAMPTVALEQCYPNPAHGLVNINYSVAQRTPVTITVNDVLGREVARLVNQAQDAGTHSVRYDVSKLTTGTYTYTMTAGDQSFSRTLNVVK